MGGWYAAHGIYEPEKLAGLSVARFCEALAAEGVQGVYPGANKALHLHPLLNDCDVYGHGKPTRIANSERDLRQPAGSLPVTEKMGTRNYASPWFKHHDAAIIDEYVAAFKKVCAGAKELLAGDKGNPPTVGGWHFFSHR